MSNIFDHIRTALRRNIQPLPDDHAAPPTGDTDPDDPRTFTPTDYGSASYGQWILDENGLPAYNYTMDQMTDPRAEYPTSRGTSNQHWHQIGNRRITGLAYNDGVVKAYTVDRGSALLNQYQADEKRGCMGIVTEVLAVMLYAPIRWVQLRLIPDGLHFNPGFFQRLLAAISPRNIRGYRDALHAYVGGYAYLYDGEATWATAYRYQPSKLDEPARRIFGMGYFETHTKYRNVLMQRKVYAPSGLRAGDVPALLADVQITNQRDSAVDLSYYEYWDVNVQQLTVQLVRAGVAGEIGNVDRIELNLEFAGSISRDESKQWLRFHQQPNQDAPSQQTVDEVDWYPSDIVLADLNPTPPDAYYTDKRRFFGQGGATQPDDIVRRAEGNLTGDPTAVMPFCMVIRRDLHLEPGESMVLRFAYGTAELDGSLDYLEQFRLDAQPIDPYMAMITAWKTRLAYFSTGQHAALQREMAWNAYYLLSSITYNAFYNVHVAPQGSAYLYLQGSDGAPRDQSLFTLALTYLDPTLARDMLKLVMQMSDGKTGEIPYAFSGYGIVGGAGIHNLTSDLDIFFFWSLTEYIAATGDTRFLYEEVPFYPTGTQPEDCSVLNHIRLNFKHLVESVGLGPNNLIRILQGDWSDGVVLTNTVKFPPKSSYLKTVKNGESVLNSQMALYVLPRLLKLLQGQQTPQAQALVAEIQPTIEEWTRKLEAAVAKQWQGQWYTRAIFRSFWGNKDVPYDADAINLESQVWPLITDDATSDVLIRSVYDLLDKDSATGAPTHPNGEVWPAISQLLTWGYTRRRPDLAWRQLLNNTFAAHAITFPDIWLCVWSGPDGVKTAGAGSYPGGTWSSAVTPMIDFPIMNNNQHAMALLGLLRVCGIEPTESGDGLRIKPQIPATYKLDLPLLKLDVTPKLISGEYRAIVDGERNLLICLPADASDITASINNTAITPQRTDEGITLPLTFTQGQRVHFAVTWG